ncbi:MAG: hypothetical protein ACRC4N_02245 [Gammaproteobacteria bacterium]
MAGQGEEDYTVTVPESADRPAIEQAQSSDIQINIGPQGDGEIAGPSGIETQKVSRERTPTVQIQTATDETVDLPDEILAFDPGPDFTASPYTTLNLEQAAEIFPSLAALVNDSPQNASDATTSAN